MKVFLSLFLGALISSTSPVSLLAQSAKIEANASNSNKNKDSQENISTEEHQVIVKEYCDFLNAVVTDDPHGFYEEWMEADPETACIIRSGTPGSYSYSVVKGKEDMSIAQVNLLNQARYCNWLENGQPAGPQSEKTTEDGVYTLKGDKVVVVNPNTTYFLKSDNNQETGSKTTERSLEDQVGQRAEITTNYELRTANCDNSSENLNCYLMMDPAAIEEAGKALKRDLGISGENALQAQTISVLSGSRTAELSRFTENATDSTNSNVFTIIQNHTASSNAFSASSQHIDPSLKEQTQQSIEKVISSFSTQLQNHYKKADEVWAERDRGWKEQRHCFHELQESRKQLALSEQKLEQAIQATSGEELEKTHLGKIAKYAGIAGDALGHVPELHAQVASASISKLAGFADTINATWAKVNLVLAKVEYHQISKQHELAQERNDQAREQLLPLEQRSEQMECFSTEVVVQASKKLAEQLHVQSTWRESDWRAWGDLVGSERSDQERLHLIDGARNNSNWVEEVTVASWQQNIETSKKQFVTLQKKANLIALERQYKNALQQQKRAQLQEEQKLRYFDQGKQEIEELKQEIEKRVEELERLETRDKVQFEHKKKEFIEALKELEKMQQRFQGLQKKWEEAVQRTHRQNEHLWSASEDYQNATKETERILTRIKKACQMNQELLQRIWLKEASSSYKEWSLPAIVSSQATEDNFLEEPRTSEECEPPLQRLEEVETRGRNLQLREAMMNSAGSKEKSILGTIQNLFSKPSEPLYPVQSNLDQVQEWALKKQIHPSAQDQERWAIREKLDQLQTAISVQQKVLKDSKNLLMEGKVDDGLGGDEDDGKSKFSTATKQTTSSKASSSFSASKSSIFSFGGKTLFNSSSKKESVSPLPSISEESSVSQDPQTQLRQLQEEASNLKKKYFELLTQSESERFGLSGQKAAIPFQEEADRNYAWEKADKKGVSAIKKERYEQEREKIAQEQQESWQSNTERWRAREQADHAFEIFRHAQDRAITLG
ncbi:MAG TPA: hypothetical protein VJK54_11890 [Chthoniobacterales bacterium]|nr:hypothetical protein [Chthoniobacterales bacterium]